MSRLVAEIIGNGKQVNKVILNDGTQLDADLVIVGAGVKPSTGFLQNSDLKLDYQGAIVCD